MNLVIRFGWAIGLLVPLALGAQQDAAKAINDKTALGYQVSHITTFFENGQQKQHVILSRKTKPTVYAMNIPASKVSDHLAKFKKQGYRPLDFDVYEVNGQIYYSIVSKKDDRTYYCRYGLSRKLFDEWIADNESEYLDLADFDGFENQGGAIFCGILLYDDYLTYGSGYRRAYDLSGSDFEKQVKDLAALSFYPKNIDVYVNRGDKRYSASFVKSEQPSRYFTDRNLKQAKKLITEWIAEGYFVLNLKAYEVEGRVMYAACAEKSSQDCEVIWDLKGALVKMQPDLKLIPEFAANPLDGPVTVIVRNNGNGPARDVQIQVTLALDHGDPKEVYLEKLGSVAEGSFVERSLDLGLKKGIFKKASVEFRVKGTNFEGFYESRSFSKE